MKYVEMGFEITIFMKTLIWAALFYVSTALNFETVFNMINNWSMLFVVGFSNILRVIISTFAIYDEIL